MIDILVTLISGIFFASFFAYFYYNIAKKKPSRKTLTIIASIIILFMSFGLDFSLPLKIILPLIGIPMSYYSLTEENNLLKEIYQTKMSKLFIFIIFGIITLTLIYFVNYSRNPYL